MRAAAQHTPPLTSFACLPHLSGNASQEELMVKDECILVDEQDNVTGHANKYKSHR